MEAAASQGERHRRTVSLLSQDGNLLSGLTEYERAAINLNYEQACIICLRRHTSSPRYRQTCCCC